MRRDLVLVLACGVAACGTPMSTTDAGADAGSGADGGGVLDAGLGDAGTLAGTFTLIHTVSQFGDSSSLFGKVYDGPTPATMVWTVDLSDGDCRVEVPRVPFCATPCGGSAACVEDNVCQAYPSAKPVGTMHVSGVRVGADGGAVMDFDMTPVVNGYQPPASTSLSIPPFTDGAAITLTAPGSSSVVPFTLASQGVAPMALGASSYPIATATALDLTWVAGSSATAARIEVEMDISHHGGIKGQILCDTADDGSLTISAALMTRLINLGVAGFPSVVVRRVKTGTALTNFGRVELRVTSSQEVGLTVPGVTSCTDDPDCPMGQTCQQDLTCR